MEAGQLKKWSKGYLRTTALIFFLTGMIKVISFKGTAPLLMVVDPVWGMKMKSLLAIGAIWEIGAGIFLWLNTSSIRSHVLVLWTGLVFVFYRVCLHLIGGDHLCPCLGTLTNWLIWVSPSAVDTILHFIIGWLLVGSSTFIILFNKLSRANPLPPALPA